ncbi:MAG: NTP transferase domain-containing protein [Bacteroidota bacterium]
MENSIPKLYGLVLVGGKSSRMGTDKRFLKYHGETQQKHTYALLSKVCDRVFLSAQKEQVSEIEEDLDSILDEDRFPGPFNGILSAHSQYPEVAWLILACDLPLMDTNNVNKLVRARNSNLEATTMVSRKTNAPEPMVTIWEPKGLERAQNYLKTTGNASVRSFLLNSEIKKVHPVDDEVLYNANFPEDYEYIKSCLGILKDE